MATKIRTDQIQNPYKFRVYRSAASTPAAGSFQKIPYETKNYDTGSNFDTTTNLFTAPVAGFYQFNARYGQANTTSNTIAFFKNGGEHSRGSQIDTSPISGTATGRASMVADIIQLAAGDTVGVYIYTNNANAADVGSATAYFSGFLISAT